MFKKIIAYLVFILLVTSVLGYVYLQGKVPTRDGKLVLDGLNSEVIVSFDTYGIPHIKANNDQDLFYAFGYIHAQDRLFQMEISRRLSQGTLAEIFGEELVGVDKLFRTVGIKAHANQWIKEIKERGSIEMLTKMQNYLDGVNAFVKYGNTPIEFDLVGIEKHEYTLEDIASIAGYMAFSFAVGLKDDSLVSYLSSQLDNSYMQDLGLNHTDGSEKIPVNNQSKKAITKEITEIISGLQPYGIFHGSNSWVLSPHRSESGQAMLVNDPHIAFSQPSVWYEAQLSSPSTEIYGHFLGLVPLPMLGLSETHAWGLTMFANDDMDLYREKVNPENANQYWAVDQWLEFETRMETIKVKDSEDINFEVRTTRHGPVINNIYSQIKGENQALEKFSHPISLWWEFLKPGNQMMEAFHELLDAKDMEDARNAASKIHAPGLNLMYANSKGDIGWWASARLPIRPKGSVSKMILNGASGEDDILGYYEFRFNPQNENPESGILYSANNQPDNTGIGLVPGYYSPTDRPSRILELLSAKEKYSVEDMKVMLIDSQTPTAQLFKEIAVPVLEKKIHQLSNIEAKALDVLVKWSLNHDPIEVGATLYNRFRIQLMRLAMEDEIGEDLYTDLQFRFLMAKSIWRIMKNEDSPWWDNINTSQVETRDELIILAWQQTVAFLVQQYGKEIDNWQWQDDIQLVHQHPLGKIPLFNG